MEFTSVTSAAAPPNKLGPDRSLVDAGRDFVI
jgi:hypothetical protein